MLLGSLLWCVRLLLHGLRLIMLLLRLDVLFLRFVKFGIGAVIVLLVNVIGCFLFGWLFSLFEGRAWFSDTLQLAIFTGFLGSFTTFATFGWNTLELFRTGQIALALGNVGANAILGLVAVWLGFILAR